MRHKNENQISYNTHHVEVAYIKYVLLSKNLMGRINMMICHIYVADMSLICHILIWSDDDIHVHHVHHHLTMLTCDIYVTYLSHICHIVNSETAVHVQHVQSLTVSVSECFSQTNKNHPILTVFTADSHNV